MRFTLRHSRAGENFYVIIGSAAGALIGLQFVVTTLIADMPITRAEAQASEAFAAPSVVHFGVVLFLSALVSAPWKELGDGLTAVSVLWLGGTLRRSVHHHRGTAYAGANRLQARVRRPVVSCSASIYFLRHARRIAMRGLLASAARPVPRGRRGAAPALHWHSQCVGQHHVSRLCQETETTGVQEAPVKSRRK